MKKTKNSSASKNNGGEVGGPMSAAQITDAKSAPSLAQGLNLTQAVQFALAQGYNPATPTLQEALPEFMASKAACDRNYQTALLSDLRLFVDVLPQTHIHTIPPNAIHDYLCAQAAFHNAHGPWSQHRKLKALSHISAFFGWAVNKQYCVVNPAARVQLSPPPPPLFTILDPHESKSLLNASFEFEDGSFAAYPILRTWVALRPLEVNNLESQDVDLAAQKLFVHRGAGLRTRVVDLAPNVVALFTFLHERGQLTKKSFCPARHQVEHIVSSATRLARASANGNNSLGGGVPFYWLKSLRATGLHYHFTLCGNLQKTAWWGGCSSNTILHRRHNNPVTRTQAEAFWKLVPDDIGAQLPPLPLW
jgi:site-specific recombinase XerD